MSPRWSKVFQDLRIHLGSTFLLVLLISFSVGFAGFVGGVFFISLVDMENDYQASNPRSAWIFTDPFNSDFLTALKKVPGVGDVEGRGFMQAKILTASGQQKSAYISSIPALSDVKIDRIEPLDIGGTVPPLGDHEAWIENSARQGVGLQPGDQISVIVSGGQVKTLRLSGFVHSVMSFPYTFGQQVSLFITPETMVWLGGTYDYNQIVMKVAERPMDEAHIREVAKAVSEKVEESGRTAYSTFVLMPGRHYASDTTSALGALMGAFTVFNILLSSFLILSTVNAIVNQQVRQIGMMKAIGARTNQLVGMYLVFILLIGLIGLGIGWWLTELSGGSAGSGVAGMLNYRPGPGRISLEITIIQVFVGLVIPLSAALVPVVKNTSVTVREAISNYGLGAGSFGSSWIDRLVERIRGLPRPLLISLRNTIRRKARLLLTLFGLVLAGTFFIATFNLGETMGVAIQETIGYVLSDVNIGFEAPYRLDKVEEIALSIPGVVEAESWGQVGAAILTEDGSTSTEVTIYSPPAKSTFIDPTLTSGRWLLPQDENALVIGNHLTARRPELGTGDKVIMEIDGRQSEWTIVGTYRMAGGSSSPIIYTNNEYLTKFLHNAEEAISLRIRTEQHDQISQKLAAQALEAAYQRAGIRLGTVQTGTEIIELNRAGTNIIVYFLLAMTIGIALIGGIGLMSSMSLNVIERMREIGVIRAIGATNGNVMMMVLVEGILIGILSCLIGSLLSFPLGAALAYIVGVSMLQSPLTYVFTSGSFLLWLTIVIVISIFSSLIPAIRATRMTVREVLAYE